MWERLGITAYAKNQTTSSSFIEDNYVDPNSVSLSFPEKKRNLIYIFLESMENTYSSEEYGGAFSENTIPELTELSLENENFSGDQETLNMDLILSRPIAEISRHAVYNIRII